MRRGAPGSRTLAARSGAMNFSGLPPRLQDQCHGTGLVLRQRLVDERLRRLVQRCILRLARHADHLRHRARLLSIAAQPHRLADRVLPRPVAPRKRLVHHRYLLRALPVPRLKPAAAQNRNPQRVGIPRRNDVRPSPWPSCFFARDLTENNDARDALVLSADERVEIGLAALLFNVALLGGASCDGGRAAAGGRTRGCGGWLAGDRAKLAMVARSALRASANGRPPSFPAARRLHAGRNLPPRITKANSSQLSVRGVAPPSTIVFT